MKIKLKFSKKDIVPLITTFIFFSWISTWIIFLIFRWIIEPLTLLFYILLLIPWIILILIVWVNWRKIYKDILGREYKVRHFDPLYIREGLVRLFQMILIFTIFIYYIILNINNIVSSVPTGILVVVNAILAYFGFTPSEVLPKDYVLETIKEDVPTNKKLLHSLPLVKSALNEFEKKSKSTLDMLDDFIDRTIGNGNEIITSIDQMLEDVKKIQNNIPYSTFSRDPFDKYNYLILLLLLAIINIVAQPLFSIPSYIALPTFSIFGVLIGISSRGKINGTISNKILENIDELKNNLNKMRSTINSASDISNNIRDEFQKAYKTFIESNFLDFLPANYSSVISVAFVSFLSLLIFIFPLPIPETFFTTMQWFVLYYFTSKQ